MARTKGSKNKVKRGGNKTSQTTQDENFFSEIGRMGGESKGKRGN